MEGHITTHLGKKKHFIICSLFIMPGKTKQFKRIHKTSYVSKKYHYSIVWQDNVFNCMLFQTKCLTYWLFACSFAQFRNGSISSWFFLRKVTFLSTKEAKISTTAWDMISFNEFKMFQNRSSFDRKDGFSLLSLWSFKFVSNSKVGQAVLMSILLT